MTYIVQYENELFISGEREDDKQVLFTLIREKALKHKFTQTKKMYIKLVKITDFKKIKPYNDLIDNKYRVKYKNHFFYADFESEDKLLMANHGPLSSYYSSLYDMEYDYYNAEATKWVLKTEIIPVDQILNEHLGLYQGMVIRVISEKNGMYQIFMNVDFSSKDIDFDFSDWKKWDDYYMKWVPKKEVYVYGSSNEPLRY